MNIDVGGTFVNPYDAIVEGSPMGMFYTNDEMELFTSVFSGSQTNDCHFFFGLS